MDQESPRSDVDEDITITLSDMQDLLRHDSMVERGALAGGGERQRSASKVLFTKGARGSRNAHSPDPLDSDRILNKAVQSRL